MAEYLVTYQETLSRTVIVKADSASEAEDLVYEAVNCSNLVLDADDYDCGSGKVVNVKEYEEGDAKWYRWCQRL